MKIVRKPERVTIVVIPDADQSVHRFTVQRRLLVSIPFLAILLLLLCALFFGLYTNNHIVKNELQAELSAKQAHYAQLIGEKEQTIRKLQADIAGLSEQTGEVMDKMEQLEQLEDELRGMTGKIEAESEPDPLKTASSSPYIHNRFVGGDPYPLLEKDTPALTSTTKQTLLSLQSEMDALYTDLSDMKKEVVALQHLQEITPTIWPVSSRTVTSRYGFRKDPFTGIASFHSGIDIGATTDTAVHSAAAGTVETANYHDARGYNIVIKHGNGIKTWYMHLSKMLVEEGDQVTKGQEIGYVGSTGRSTGPHLHYEVLINGEKVDPAPYMNSSS
ncbi:peptidoglycan DD-metalloendopeptidase family protein [Marinicrinis lubricantis]|uniref:Peptidoglycan DD-metalloendopeptidase family protein n=1 Tax=Marinicrinis lubricantis TaxID=2086470 RepID=A0ABW1IR88_9BACL